MKLDLSVATTRGSILDSTTRKCTFTVPTLKAWKKRNESSRHKSKCDCDCDLDFRPQWFYNKASTSTTYFIRFQYRSKSRSNAEVGQSKIFSSRIILSDEIDRPRRICRIILLRLRDQPLQALDELPLELVVQDVGHVLREDLLSARTSVDAAEILNIS